MADDPNRDDNFDYGRDYGAGRSSTHSSARDYAAAGRLGRDDRNFRGGGTGYGGRPEARDDDGGDRFGREDRFGRGEPAGGYGQDRGRMQGDDRGGQHEQGRGQYRGAPQGYRYQDRGFFDRAGDEVRSWFGDDEAERRREHDQRYDERYGDPGSSRSAHDEHYSSWRRGQIAALDRDYDEYRQENATRFDNAFGAWRTERQTQRGCLARVTEHMDVVGSDGLHVGTVDKVRGDRIALTKSDPDAGGRHHSIPSRWIESVDDKVTIRKTAEEAKTHWRDEERSGAMFGDEPRHDRDTREDRDRQLGRDGRTDLNRSFSGTY